MLKPFLTAHWKYLAMLNFAVDPELFAPHVPAGTELDFCHDETYVSIVGFSFIIPSSWVCRSRATGILKK